MLVTQTLYSNDSNAAANSKGTAEAAAASSDRINNNNDDNDDHDHDDGGGDAGGFGLPLTRLMYSHSARRLLKRHPKDIIEELEGFYCGQCLENFPSTEAMQNKGRCSRVECQKSPQCGAMLAVVKENRTGDEPPMYFLRCGHCFWDSRIVNLEAGDGKTLGQIAAEAEVPMGAQDRAEFDAALACVRAILSEQERERELEKRLSSRTHPSTRSSIFLELAKIKSSADKVDNMAPWSPTMVDEMLSEQ